MWEPEDTLWGIGSFLEPVPLPGSDPDDEPLVMVVFNAGWLPYICGALSQLVQIPTWSTTNPTALALVQAQATDLIAMFGAAVPAMTPYPISNAGTASPLITNGGGSILATEIAQ